MNQTQTEIKFYHGEDWLSNFHPSPITDLHGVVWPTVEHAFQGAKAQTEEDRVRIWKAGTPKQAKYIGRSIPRPHDWDDVRVGVMRDIVYAKFKQNPELRKLLVATGSAILIEDSPTDYFWGCGARGTGENMLGKILMDVREILA